MDHTLEFLRKLDPGLDLAALMIEFIGDLRRIIIHPEMRLDVKLAAIERRVDQLAPPPRADGGTGPLEAVTRVELV
jgi:hypothetical protein